MRNTKIVCTLGPATANREGIGSLIDAGMNIARINFSHGSADGHKETMRLIREVSSEKQRPIGILLDTKGPEIRTEERDDKLEIKEGDEVAFAAQPLLNEARPTILVNYDGFLEDAKKTKQILVDNGEIFFDVLDCHNDRIIAKALGDGSIGSRRHVNLPGVFVSLPAITEKDWADLRVGVEEQVDMVALSFIRTADEIREVRAFTQTEKSNMLLIAKIETQQAVDNIEEIVEASDGIMVARGDLGAELPYERIPAIQDHIVQMCRKAGKPVIVATHMLESMIQHPMPTRAEVTDVAHAAVTRADATMLSAETAVGKHPAVAVRAMSRILQETESTSQAAAIEPTDSEPIARAKAAIALGASLDAGAIVVLTEQGNTTKALSQLRPTRPVIAITEDLRLARQLQLYYGIYPLIVEGNLSDEQKIAVATEALANLENTDSKTIVLVSNLHIEQKTVRTVQVREV